MTGTPPTAPVAVRVKGNSMRDQHLCDGDYLIVHAGRPAQAGDVVLVTVGLEGRKIARGCVGRYFPARSNGVFLEGLVTRKRDWFASSDVRVEGIVAGVIRRFGVR